MSQSASGSVSDPASGSVSWWTSQSVQYLVLSADGSELVSQPIRL